MKWLFAFVVSGVAIAPSPGRAQIAIVLHPVSDTYVNSGYPDENYGSEEALFVHAGTTTKRTFLQFDLGGIAPQTIADASLRLLYGQAAPGGTLIDLHRVEQDAWDEASLTWRNMPPHEILPLGTAGIALGKAEVVWHLPSSLFVSDLDGRVSLLLKVQNEGLNGTAVFFSKESVLPLARPPELVLSIPEPGESVLLAGLGLMCWAACAIRRAAPAGRPNRVPPRGSPRCPSWLA